MFSAALGFCKESLRFTTESDMKYFLSFLFSLSLVFPVIAQSKSLLNIDKNQIAIQGYDPVAFFTDNKPVKGVTKFSSSHNGANYLFASKEHKDLFDKEPSKYEPAFGGYCAFGVSRNKLVEIDPEAFQIVDGHLLLQYSKSVRNDFNKDTQGNLAKANANWPGLVEKKGK
jgi:YHS domain-containing protein